METSSKDIQVGNLVKVGNLIGNISRIEANEVGNQKRVYWRRIGDNGELNDEAELYDWAIDITKVIL